jgi:hypothetical protein
MASRPSTTNLLRKFVELFVNGILPEPLWKFLSFAIIIPFYTLAHMKRMLLADPSLIPITIGALLTHFSVRSVLRMQRKRYRQEPADFELIFIRSPGWCS